MGHKRKREEADRGEDACVKATSTKRHAGRDSQNPAGITHASSVLPQNPYQSTLIELDAKLPPTAQLGHVPSHPSATCSPPSQSSQPPPLPELSQTLQDAPFTHSSRHDDKYRKGASYDRLEFLGDAYLEIMATRLIYSRFVHLPVGKLSALREKLIKNATLSKFATQYEFEKRIKMDKAQEKRFVNLGLGGSKPQKNGGQIHSPEKIMADVFEAYVAAVVLSDNENGFARAEAWMSALWAKILLEASEDAAWMPVENRKDELSRLVGGKDVKLDYEIQHVGPKTSDQKKIASVYMTGWGYSRMKLGQGEGQNSKEAGMRAAIDALDNNREFIDQVSEVKREFDNERRERLARERGLIETTEADTS